MGYMAGKEGFTGKALGIAEKATWVTLPASAGLWAAGELAPGVVASLGANPETVSRLGKTGVIFDAIGLVGIKLARGGMKHESQGGQGKARRVVGAVASPFVDTAKQLNPLQKSSRHALIGF